METERIKKALKMIQAKYKGYPLMAFYEIDSFVDFWHIVIPDYNLYIDAEFKKWLLKVRRLFTDLKLLFCCNPLTYSSGVYDNSEDHIVIKL